LDKLMKHVPHCAERKPSAAAFQLERHEIVAACKEYGGTMRYAQAHSSQLLSASSRRREWGRIAAARKDSDVQ